MELWKKGDRVKCINPGVVQRSKPNDQLVLGKIYTVSKDMLPDKNNVYVEEVAQGMFPERFVLWNKEKNITELLNRIDEL